MKMMIGKSKIKIHSLPLEIRPWHPMAKSDQVDHPAMISNHSNEIHTIPTCEIRIHFSKNVTVFCIRKGKLSFCCSTGWRSIDTYIFFLPPFTFWRTINIFLYDSRSIVEYFWETKDCKRRKNLKSKHTYLIFSDVKLIFQNSSSLQ